MLVRRQNLLFGETSTPPQPAGLITRPASFALQGHEPSLPFWEPGHEPRRDSDDYYWGFVAQL